MSTSESFLLPNAEEYHRVAKIYTCVDLTREPGLSFLFRPICGMPILPVTGVSLYVDSPRLKAGYSCFCRDHRSRLIFHRMIAPHCSGVLRNFLKGRRYFSGTGSITFKARVTSEGLPVNGAAVSFIVDGTEMGQSTSGTDGLAQISWTSSYGAIVGKCWLRNQSTHRPHRRFASLL